MNRRDTLAASILYLFVFAIYLISPCATPFDSRWTIPTALSMIHEHNTDLNEYLPLLERDKFYAIECMLPDGSRIYPIKSASQCASGKLYDYYPVAVPLLASPFVFALETGLHAAQPVLAPLARSASTDIRRSFLRGDLIASSMFVELLLASLWMAAAAVVMYFVARQFLGLAGSLVIAGVFAFGTPAWSICSRALWQHGPSVLLSAVVLLIAGRAGRNPRLIRYLGIPLALAFFVRPTNVIALVLLSLFVLIYYRKGIPWFFGGMVPVFAVFTAMTWLTYGSLIAPYSSGDKHNVAGFSIHPEFVQALAGNLISPGRGLFVYVPVALLSVAGILFCPLDRQAGRLRPFLLAVIVAHWVLISAYEDWIGGFCYGPRYFSDMSALVIWFLIPVVAALGAQPKLRFTLGPVFAVLALVSGFMHYQGACQWECVRWNVTPIDLRFSRYRVWDWRDPAFLRSFRSVPAAAPAGGDQPASQSAPAVVDPGGGQ